jgi:hypothetical protein
MEDVLKSVIDNISFEYENVEGLSNDKYKRRVYNRKDNFKRKMKKCHNNDKDDIHYQLCMLLYKAKTNGEVVETNSKENKKLEKQLEDYKNENDKLQSQIETLRNMNQTLRDSQVITTNIISEYDEDYYKDIIDGLHKKNNKLKEELKFNQDDLDDRNNIITRLNMDKRHYINNMKPDDEKDIEIQNLKDQLIMAREEEYMKKLDRDMELSNTLEEQLRLKKKEQNKKYYENNKSKLKGYL